MIQILLVDDAIFMRDMLKQIIKRDTIDIIEAADGKEAIDQYVANRPDLVFMDITMPDMDGIAALRQIKEIDPACKVVMCTAMAQQNVVVEAMQAGAKDYIVKPFNAAKIQSVLKQYCPECM